MTFRCPEVGRVVNGAYGTRPGDPYGAFFIRSPDRKERTPLKVIATDGDSDGFALGWEHVSVSLPNRCPTWLEMDHVKGLFWSDEDAVMQLHPPRSDWVNNHPHCLHLWRPTKAEIPLPPSLLVGFKDVGVLPL